MKRKDFIIWIVMSSIIITYALLMSSCVTQKKCNSKFPPQVIRERYDSLVVKDTVIYKDKIVEVKIPGKTDTIDRLIPGIPPDINTKPVILENDYAEAKAWIQNSKLKLELNQKDQVLKFKLDSAEKISRHWEFQYRKLKELTTPPPVKETPKFWLVTGFAFITLVVCALIYFLLKFIH